jgi:hypothetical protein
MNKPAHTPNPIIAKLARIMMLIEHSIYHESDLLAENREKFIAQTAFNLTHLEDSFFSGDQIVKLITIMVKYHESGVNKWRIDIDNCTAEYIAITVDPGHNLKIPSNAFIQTVTPISGVSEQPRAH